MMQRVEAIEQYPKQYDESAFESIYDLKPTFSTFPNARIWRALELEFQTRSIRR